MSQGVMFTTQGETDQDMTHKQDVNMSLEVVYKGCEHVQRQHAPSDHTACAGWMPQHATKTIDKSHTATVKHECVCSLLKPCSTNSTRPIDVVSS